jgi:hypothetical protein
VKVHRNCGQNLVHDGAAERLAQLEPRETLSARRAAAPHVETAVIAAGATLALGAYGGLRDANRRRQRVKGRRHRVVSSCSCASANTSRDASVRGGGGSQKAARHGTPKRLRT